jgi:hypothetical protein
MFFILFCLYIAIGGIYLVFAAEAQRKINDNWKPHLLITLLYPLWPRCLMWLGALSLFKKANGKD